MSEAAPLALTSSQRKWLRGRAHELHPLVQIGQQGLTPGVLAALAAELAVHELIKVRIAAPREAKEAIAAELEARLGCALAGLVGHVAILFRPHADPERRRIELPA